MKNRFHNIIYLLLACFFVSLLLSQQATASSGNTTIDSFSKAKKLLLNKVYYDHRKTIYCDAEFLPNKKTILPEGYASTKYVKRSKKIEWEHQNPAQNFGQSFKEWRDGDPECVNSKGKKFKGRNCASKVNMEYRYMQADLFNLAPAVGSVNALRSNYRFTMLPDAESSFGSCDMRIENRKAQPPEIARGQIARAYLYMDDSYPKYNMSKSQKKLMQAWHKMYPVSEWECTRAERIKAIQKNDNVFVSQYCE